MTKSISKLGKRLRELREERRLTQDDLSDLSGVARIVIARLETGGQEGLRDRTAGALAKALRVSLDELSGAVVISESASLVDAYLASLYAKADHPTPGEIEKMRSLPSIVSRGLAPSPETIHEFLQWLRRSTKNQDQY